MSKMLVTGPRTINDVEYIYAVLDGVKWMYGFDEIIVGDARGVDRRTMDWCAMQAPQIPFTTYKAYWDIYGLSAGPLRNLKMVKLCDFGIGIWDGKSRGTKHCIGALRDAKKLLMVFRYE